MDDLTLASRLSLYVLLALMGGLAALIWGWQAMVLRGKAMQNPDGTVDDWHQQRTHYGLSVADVFLACPVALVTIPLVLFSSRWGFWLFAMLGFWFVYTNLMTTSTSLRFENPKITPMWLFVYPFGIVVGLAMLVWSGLHLDLIAPG